MNQPVVIFGGGLGGIAAAVRLAGQSVPVTLIETRRRLGGRATSHVDPASGQLIDNCQHILLGCCTNLVDLYNRLDVPDRIAWHDKLYFADKQGHRDILSGAPLPAPAHLLPALLRMGCLSRSDKQAICRGMFSLIRTGRRGRADWTDHSFARWLEVHRQPRAAIDRFWELIIISACNQTAAECSAAYALQVFQDAFAASRSGYQMGVPNVPLGQLYEQAVAVIERAGGAVLLGESVRALGFDGRRVTSVTTDQRTITAETFISALPFDRLLKVAQRQLIEADNRLINLDQLVYSPIIGIHLWFKQAVLKQPHLIFVDSPLQWVFRRSDPTPWFESAGGSAANGHPDAPTPPQHLHGVVSAGHRWVDQPRDRIIDMALDELGAYVDADCRACLDRAMIIKERRATFSPAPGVDAYRPETTGAVANLLLAGDYCDTGWPATMEGAVRSGYAAAGALLGRDLLQPDQTPALLYRLLSR